MDPRPAPGRLKALSSADAGLASLEFVVAAALAMVFVVGLVQVIAYQYTKGAVTAALERGARAGAVAGGGERECLAALSDSLAEVLGGVVGDGLTAGCTVDEETVRAHATGSVPSWMAGPSLAFDLEVLATREPGP